MRLTLPSTGPAVVAGSEHELLYDDGVPVAFLNRYPTLRGYALVVPRRHLTDVVRDLSSAECLALQAVVHEVARLGAAIRTALSGSR